MTDILKGQIFKVKIDEFLAKSGLDAATCRALEGIAGVMAHLTAGRGEKPNLDRLQRSWETEIYNILKPIDEIDPAVQQEIAEGITLECLIEEAELMKDLLLHKATWVAFALGEAGQEREADNLRLLEEHQLDLETIQALNVIAGMKASVYAGSGEPNLTSFQDMRSAEVYNCLIGISSEQADFDEEIAGDELSREMAKKWADAEKQRLLDQANWVAFALNSADAGNTLKRSG